MTTPVYKSEPVPEQQISSEPATETGDDRQNETEKVDEVDDSAIEGVLGGTSSWSIQGTDAPRRSG